MGVTENYGHPVTHTSCGRLADDATPVAQKSGVWAGLGCLSRTWRPGQESAAENDKTGGPGCGQSWARAAGIVSVLREMLGTDADRGVFRRAAPVTQPTWALLAIITTSTRLLVRHAPHCDLRVGALAYAGTWGAKLLCSRSADS